MKQPGIYVEIAIAGTLDEVWRLTQAPDLHQRWDLRFTSIEYLPRPSLEEPQRFLYETRIGLGLAIRGTGESIGERVREDGSATSSLRFASDDPKSLIREGAGYWRYVPQAQGVRFFTWYDYRVRFGWLGRAIDALVFRPLMGWATAWSFDRLRLWIEQGRPPELSLRLALMHAVARLGVAGVWIWHGLVPKLLFRNVDERTMLAQAGLPLRLLPVIGAAEIVVGLVVLLAWRSRSVFALSGLAMLMATVAVVLRSPAYITAAFNPITLNGLMIALSVVGWLASGDLPSARHCLRRAPVEEGR